MSCFINTTPNQGHPFQAPFGVGNECFNDESLQRSDYKTITGNAASATPMLHADVLWPRSHGQGGSYVPDPASQMWEWNVYATGSRHGMLFTGKTVDANGAALGGCTVMLFNTATNLMVDTQVSDTAGNYRLTDPNNVACFIVAYLAGSPDVTGVTTDALTGT